MELSEIRLGDTVRLRNGEKVVVRSKFEWYEDRDGEHLGPFVGTREMDRYLLADVAGIAARNGRLCRFCGEGVTASNPETDFCEGCHYGGRALEERFAPVMARLREIPAVKDVAVWHTGGGCFNMAVILRDGRLLTPSSGFRDEGDGRVWPEPGLPEEGPWAMVVAEDYDAWSEWDEERLSIPQALYADEDELVAAVAEMAR